MMTVSSGIAEVLVLVLVMMVAVVVMMVMAVATGVDMGTPIAMSVWQERKGAHPGRHQGNRQEEHRMDTLSSHDRSLHRNSVGSAHKCFRIRRGVVIARGERRVVVLRRVYCDRVHGERSRDNAPGTGCIEASFGSHFRRIFSIFRPFASSSTSLSRYRQCRVSGVSISSIR